MFLPKLTDYLEYLEVDNESILMSPVYEPLTKDSKLKELFLNLVDKVLYQQVYINKYSSTDTCELNFYRNFLDYLESYIDTIKEKLNNANSMDYPEYFNLGKTLERYQLLFNIFSSHRLQLPIDSQLGNIVRPIINKQISNKYTPNSPEQPEQPEPKHSVSGAVKKIRELYPELGKGSDYTGVQDPSEYDRLFMRKYGMKWHSDKNFLKDLHIKEHKKLKLSTFIKPEYL